MQPPPPHTHTSNSTTYCTQHPTRPLHTPHSTLHTPHSTLNTQPDHSTLHTPHPTLHTPHSSLLADPSKGAPLISAVPALTVSSAEWHSVSNNAVGPFMREATGLAETTEPNKDEDEEKKKKKKRSRRTTTTTTTTTKKKKKNGSGSAALSIRGSGHQALCDVCLLHAPWTNKLVRQTFDGANGLELSKSVNSVVVRFLQSSGVLNLSTKKRLELAAVPGVFDLEEKAV